MRNSLKAKRAAALLISMVLLLSLTACGGKKEKAAEPAVITVGEQNIIIGETLLRELSDAGFTVASDSHLENAVPEEEKMPGRTYDVGVYFGMNGVLYGEVECLNDKEEEIPYIDSIINKVTVFYGENSDPYGLPHYNETVLVDGIDLKGMGHEEALAAFGELEDEPSTIEYPDGSVAFHTFTKGDCYFSLSFAMESQMIDEISVEMFHSKFE